MCVERAGTRYRKVTLEYEYVCFMGVALSRRTEEQAALPIPSVLSYISSNFTCTEI